MKEIIERLDVPWGEEMLVESVNEKFLVENEGQANAMGSGERESKEMAEWPTGLQIMSNLDTFPSTPGDKCTLATSCHAHDEDKNRIWPLAEKGNHISTD